MRSCDGCRWCCLAYGVSEIQKRALCHCEHECSKGCSIHLMTGYPKECREFQCPYLNGDSIYRPDTFQPLLQRLGISLKSFIPWIPVVIPMKQSKKLIRRTRSILCAVKADKWELITLKLDQPKGDVFSGSDELREAWQELWDKYAKA